jgi:PAS domain S-box-containing protein
MSSAEDAARVQRQLASDKTGLSLLTKELFERVPEAILLIDKASRAVRVNREFLRMFRYSQEEIIYKQLSSVIIPEELRKEAEHFTDFFGRANGPFHGQKTEIS